MSELFSSAPPASAQAQPGTLNRWTFSMLVNFEKCRKRVHYSHVIKAPRTQSDAAKRGNDIHEAIEAYLKGEPGPALDGTVPQYMQAWQEPLSELHGMDLMVEPPWAVDRDWRPVPWDSPKAWLRGKPDVAVAGNRLRIIDFKAGKSHGYAVQHGLQASLYAAMALDAFPHVSEFQCECWYLSEPRSDRGNGNPKVRRYGREHLEAVRRRMTEKGALITAEVQFLANPSKWTCRFCDWRETCPEAVSG